MMDNPRTLSWGRGSKRRPLLFIGRGCLAAPRGRLLSPNPAVRLLPVVRPIEFSRNSIYSHGHHFSAKVRTFINMLAHNASEQQKLIDPYS
jgi:hypothetical protein